MGTKTQTKDFFSVKEFFLENLMYKM